MQSGEDLAVLSSVIEHVEVEAWIGALHMNVVDEESSENNLVLAIILDVPLSI